MCSYFHKITGGCIRSMVTTEPRALEEKSFKTKNRVIVLLLCILSDDALYLYKFHNEILNSFKL